MQFVTVPAAPMHFDISGLLRATAVGHQPLIFFHFAGAREAARSALPRGGIPFSLFARATGSLAKVAGSADRVA